MTNESYLDQTWIIWNSFYGVHVRVEIGEVKQTLEGSQAWLDEPYEMVGPFNLQELLTKGKITFAECTVMSLVTWQRDKQLLQNDSLKKRRAAQERISDKYGGKYNNNNQQTRQAKHYSDKTHRESLNLPVTRQLQAKQIKAAFRKLAQKLHPDAGGSQEHFVLITQARDALLRNI